MNFWKTKHQFVEGGGKRITSSGKRDADADLAVKYRPLVEEEFDSQLKSPQQGNFE